MKKTTGTLLTSFNYFICLSVLYSFNTIAQPSIEWQKCLGGSKQENGYSLKPTFDGGYISAGESLSNNGDLTGHYGSTDTLDVWIVKTDSSGNIQWQQNFGGTGIDFSPAVIQTNDSGYIYVCSTFSNDGDITLNKGNDDVWVVKLNASGNILWQKTFGGSGFDVGRTIIQTIDGGYMVGAITSSTDGDVSGNHGLTDLWLLKLDAAGTLQWQKCLGGSSNDGKYAGGSISFMVPDLTVIQTLDNGYLVAGASCSNDGDITNHHGNPGINNPDYWIVKTDSTGTIQWEESYGGTLSDVISKAQHTSDGGFVLAGATLSNDGDVIGQHINANGGNSWDMWIVKINALGVVQWKNAYGGTGADHAYAVFETNDGGYFVSGDAGSANNGDVAGRRGGGSDAWILKLDQTGQILWQKCLGGSSYDCAYSGFQTSDNGFIIEGYAGSNNNDVSGNHSSGANPAFGTYHDIWMVKLSAVADFVIKGTVYEDLNGNCLRDSGEVLLKGRIVKATPGNYYASTDVLGNYSLFVDSGVYTVSHTPPVYYNQLCPVAAGTYHVVINTAAPNSFGNDFADTLTSRCADVSLSLVTSNLRSCRNNTYVIQYKNTGVVTAFNVSISINFNPSIIPVSSNIPWTVPYVFNMDSVRPGQVGYISITDSVSCNALSGDTLCVDAFISTTSTECNNSNNNVTDCHMVINSCDPNGLEIESQMNHSGYVTQENITNTDTLTYLIRFQNTGNDTAFTAVVRDTLSNYLDAFSVLPGASSHPYSFRVYGQGICEWAFNNILLTDTLTNELKSHGFVKFSVLQTQNNLAGIIIYNTASIWFDYNQPISTNTTENIIQGPLAIYEMKTQNKSYVFPNPLSQSAIIYVYQELQNAELLIFNLLGDEVLKMKNITANKISIKRNSLPGGMYIYKILQNNNLVTNGKLIIE